MIKLTIDKKLRREYRKIAQQAFELVKKALKRYKVSHKLEYNIVARKTKATDRIPGWTPSKGRHYPQGQYLISKSTEQVKQIEILFPTVKKSSFTQEYITAKSFAHAILHEIGHATGLEHVVRRDLEEIISFDKVPGLHSLMDLVLSMLPQVEMTRHRTDIMCQVNDYKSTRLNRQQYFWKHLRKHM